MDRAAAITYSLAGRKEDARSIVDQLIVLSKQRFVPAYMLAVIHLGSGEKDEALRLLEQAYVDREDDIGGIKSDPLLAPLHGDPRFEALVQRVVSQKPQ
ncbi:MAG: hypothetical protein H0U43_03125 [Chthoniobacterales bacterium]|nr:hypothetical protein [Chthoniobacterales bacterium]